MMQMDPKRRWVEREPYTIEEIVKHLPATADELRLALGISRTQANEILMYHKKRGRLVKRRSEIPYRGRPRVIYMTQEQSKTYDRDHGIITEDVGRSLSYNDIRKYLPATVGEISAKTSKSASRMHSIMKYLVGEGKIVSRKRYKHGGAPSRVFMLPEQVEEFEQKQRHLLAKDALLKDEIHVKFPEDHVTESKILAAIGSEKVDLRWIEKLLDTETYEKRTIELMLIRLKRIGKIEIDVIENEIGRQILYRRR